VAAASLATAGVPAASKQACRIDDTRAVVGGRVVCLSEGSACQHRYQKRYRRYGFRCRDGLLQYDWASLHRPLRVPRIGVGAPCPASIRRTNAPLAVSVVISHVFGPGPAYPTLDDSLGHAGAVMVWGPNEPPYIGWAGTKVLWAVPTYPGPILVRGRQLDGPGKVGFDLGPGWSERVSAEIRLSHGPIYGLRPAATFVRTPGCYAYQVDTPSRSYRIVFEARYGF
jgi:hypothetical protein